MFKDHLLHIPPHLTLPDKTTFLNYLGPLKCDFKKSSRVTQTQLLLKPFFKPVIE